MFMYWDQIHFEIAYKLFQTTYAFDIFKPES